VVAVPVTVHTPVWETNTKTNLFSYSTINLYVKVFILQK